MSDGARPADVQGAESGDRRALARAITLVESTLPDHQREAAALLERLLPRTGEARRLGVTGPPGAGKSTFIETLGLHVVERGRRPAVLAVDPTSVRSGGSVLGDKTRMPELSRRPEAFIRPTPSGGELGGVARRSRETMLVCEAFGFDVVIVETVGTGQSDLAVADMVDTFIVLIPPGGGDDLQGIKRGVMELADLVVVTKRDGDLEATANQTIADYRHALALLHGAEHAPEVLGVSAITDRGVADVWTAVAAHQDAARESGELASRRRAQNSTWMWREVTARLDADLRSDPAVEALAARLETAVTEGEVTPSAAAAEILTAYRGGAG